MNMGSVKSNGMAFSCSQKWENMLPKEQGRFCMSCQKTVIDFTSWDQGSIRAHFRSHPNSCGQFRAEQVDPSLIPLSESLRPIRNGLLAAITALTIQSSNAQQVAPAPTELSNSADRSGQIPIKSNETNGAVIKMTPTGPVCMRPEPKLVHRSRYRVYVSGRFPFIHVRDRNRRGRISMGVPSF